MVYAWVQLGEGGVKGRMRFPGPPLQTFSSNICAGLSAQELSIGILLEIIG
jgi:hypothetical protein